MGYRRICAHSSYPDACSADPETAVGNKDLRIRLDLSKRSVTMFSVKPEDTIHQQ